MNSWHNNLPHFPFNRLSTFSLTLYGSMSVVRALQGIERSGVTSLYDVIMTRSMENIANMHNYVVSNARYGN